jgi:hypothetical protein
MTARRPRIYTAHPMMCYGTVYERLCLDAIDEHFPGWEIVTLLAAKRRVRGGSARGRGSCRRFRLSSSSPRGQLGRGGVHARGRRCHPGRSPRSRLEHVGRFRTARRDRL